MLRKIVKIDRDTCTGCGTCVAACHEGAIQMIGGKAVVTREDYCDGLGNCLPACPAGAIAIEEREAVPFDGEAVKAASAARAAQEKKPTPPAHIGCPGAMARVIPRGLRPCHDQAGSPVPPPAAPGTREAEPGCLRQWPVQIKLVPVNAPYFAGASLLVAADCTAFACASFHRDFIAGRVTLIGCPKLDWGNSGEKLACIIKDNDIRSILVARMVVPCCGGIESAVCAALAAGGKNIPCEVVTFGLDGRVVGRRS